MFPCPFFETPKNGQIPFYIRNTYNMSDYKKDKNPPPPFTTCFMNFIVIEIHVLPRQNLELAILLPSRQRWTSVDVEQRMIYYSDRHESPTTLRGIFFDEKGKPLCFYHGTSEPLFSSVHRDKKCRTPTSSRKKGLTEPGSLTNTNIKYYNIENIKYYNIEKIFFSVYLSSVLLPRALAIDRIL